MGLTEPNATLSQDTTCDGVENTLMVQPDHRLSPDRNSPSTERTSFRSVWGCSRRVLSPRAPREGLRGVRREVPGTETRSRSMDGPVVPALPCAAKPRQLRRIRSHSRRALLAMAIRHAVAQRALRVIESEATGALPHSVVMFVTMGVDCGGLIGLTLPFEHSDELGLLSCVVAGSRQCRVGSLGGGEWRASSMPWGERLSG